MTLQPYIFAGLPTREELIIKEVAKASGVKYSDIMGRVREKQISMARQCYCYILTQFCGLTLNEAGKILNLDHSTIHINSRQFKIDLAINRSRVTSVLSLIEKLKMGNEL